MGINYKWDNSNKIPENIANHFSENRKRGI